MLHRIPNENEFWEVFRDVTRKLAARCRRVRHSKKTRCEAANEQSNTTVRIRDCNASCIDNQHHRLTSESIRNASHTHLSNSPPFKSAGIGVVAAP
ncbi:unnamed protein product [Anisakis simplex]|nr:unnamed protein product [Anisakis simplex]